MNNLQQAGLGVFLGGVAYMILMFAPKILLSIAGNDVSILLLDLVGPMTFTLFVIGLVSLCWYKNMRPIALGFMLSIVFPIIAVAFQTLWV